MTGHSSSYPETAQSWEVEVRVNGDSVLTIGHNHLTGMENIDDYADTIESCANHLLAFIGRMNGYGAAAQGWRDIETAPKDREIIVFRPGAKPEGRGVVIPQVGTDRWFENRCWGRSNKSTQPTLWKPMPAAPSVSSTNRLCPNGLEHGNCLLPNCVSSCPGRLTLSSTHLDTPGEGA